MSATTVVATIDVKDRRRGFMLRAFLAFLVSARGSRGRAGGWGNAVAAFLLRGFLELLVKTWDELAQKVFEGVRCNCCSTGLCRFFCDLRFSSVISVFANRTYRR